MVVARRRVCPVLGFALALAAVGPVLTARVPPPQDPLPAAPPATIPIEVAAIDRDGEAADGLRLEHFAVSVDGKPRRVLWVRYVSRGPGAARDSMLRRATRTETFRVAAEPARNVLVVVDESSIQRGAERPVTQAAGALIDRLGLDDRIGVIRFPLARDSRVALTTVRPEVREALSQVLGQASLSAGGAAGLLAAQQQQAAGDPEVAAEDPAQAAGVERPPVETPRTARADENGAMPPASVAEDLRGLLASLRSSPERKVILLFSGGLPPASSRLEELTIAAAAAHVVIYGFGIQGDHDEMPGAPDLAALERLAKSTGGSLTRLGRNVDRNIERVVIELASCYVLGVERLPSDGDGRRHSLRVEAPRQPVTVRAPAFLVPTADVEDVEPPIELSSDAAAARPGGPPSLDRPPSPAARVTTGRSAAASARDAEVQRLLARAIDYVAGYAA